MQKFKDFIFESIPTCILIIILILPVYMLRMAGVYIFPEEVTDVIVAIFAFVLIVACCFWWVYVLFWSIDEIITQIKKRK